MKGDPDVIELLNEVLTAELTAINQYFIHAKMCEDWGYHRLAKKKRHESIEEMHHADWVISRILLLEGVPNMQRLFPVRVGENAVEQHELGHRPGRARRPSVPAGRPRPHSKVRLSVGVGGGPPILLQNKVPVPDGG